MLAADPRTERLDVLGAADFPPEKAREVVKAEFRAEFLRLHDAAAGGPNPKEGEIPEARSTRSIE